MSLYDQYQLSNSTATPAYVGSDLDTKIGVLSQLQQRYDQNRGADDMLSRTIGDTIVAPNDQAAFDQVAAKYRQRLSQRAQSGNYEDMQMGVAKDGYDFADEIRPFQINMSKIQQRIQDIDKQAERGKDGKPGITANVADMLKQEVWGAPGIQRDPKTGQVHGYTTFPAIALSTDRVAKVQDYIRNVVSQDTGREVKNLIHNTDGSYQYQDSGGKVQKVTPEQLQRAVQTGMKLDAQFAADVNQEARLKSSGTEKASYDDIASQGIRGRNLADQIQQEAQKQGVPFGQIYKRMVHDNVVDGIHQDAVNFGLNAQQHNVSTFDKTEGFEQNRDPNSSGTNFAIPVTLGAYGSAFNTPDKLQDELSASKQRQNQIGQDYNEWVHSNGIKKVGDNYIDRNGTDVTDQAIRQRLQTEQEQKHQTTLQKIDEDAKRETNYKVTPADIKRAEAARTAVYRDESGPAMNRTAEETKNEAEQAYKRALNENPRYADYQQAIADKTQKLTLNTSAMRFANPKDNDKMEALVNGLSTTDFKSNMLALKHIGTGENNGQPLTPDEYDNIKGNISYGGQVIGADGQQHHIFTATDPKTKKTIQFSMDGITSNQPMPKLYGIDSQQAYSQQMIRAALNNEGKNTSIPIAGGHYVNIRALGPDEASKSGRGKYVMSISGKDGKGGTEVNLDSEDEVLKRIIDIQKLQPSGR